MIPDLMTRLFGASWRTSVCTLVTVLFGFIAFKPQYFSHWPLLVDLSSYAALGGFVAFGIAAKDNKQP